MNSHEATDKLLTAHKPRPWGEGISLDSSTFTKPDPSSKTNIPVMGASRQFFTGSMVVPWNSFSA